MTIQRVDILYTIRQFYNNMLLIADIMYVNNILFVASVLENINYGMVGVVDNLACPKPEGEL